MRYLKWIVSLALALILILFMHYTLPDRDIVKIVGTDVKRMDISGTSLFWVAQKKRLQTQGTRDVRFLNATWPDGKARVYRNEDTEWSWPPYFKFDSSNITAEAQSLAQRDNVWVAVSHYGWRIEFLSVFPNVLKIREVSGPEVTLIPWFNIFFFILLATLLFVIYRAINAFKKQRIDPLIDNIEDMVDDVSASASETRQTLENKKSSLVSWIKNHLPFFNTKG